MHPTPSMFRMGNTPTVVMLPLLFSPSCPDNPAVLVENNITHILSVHDNAEPGFSVSQDTCVYCCFLKNVLCNAFITLACRTMNTNVFTYLTLLERICKSSAALLELWLHLSVFTVVA